MKEFCFLTFHSPNSPESSFWVNSCVAIQGLHRKGPLHPDSEDRRVKHFYPSWEMVYFSMDFLKLLITVSIETLILGVLQKDGAI